jgi:hypothetical protein
MWKTRIIVSAVFLLLVLGTRPLQFAQDAPTSSKDPDAERRGVVLGLVRTINTIEVTELIEYGSYAPWPILLAHHQEFNGWLKRFYSSGEPNTHFSDMPEILPGWNLRLNVQTDGKGYVLLLDDASDKTGFAWVSDERGIIRQCKSLQ